MTNQSLLMICFSEIWKDIPEYKGLYQVSNFGNVRTLPRSIQKKMYGGKEGSYKREGKNLKPGLLRGYKHVSLCKQGKIRVFKVHRLVLSSFKPISNYEQLQVNHKNGNKGDNRLFNLEWVSAQDNQIHRHQKLYNSNKSSKYSYITKCKDKWRLKIAKDKHIGYFDTEEEAKKKLDSLILLNPNINKI